MGRILIKNIHHRLGLTFLVLISFSIQYSSAAAVCWDCDMLDAKSPTDEEQSNGKQQEGSDHSENVVSSNALDSLFRDPPQDTSYPPKEDNDVKNNNQNDQYNNNNNEIDNPQTSSDYDGGQDESVLPPPGRWAGIDTLVAIFFAIAAVWLIAATVYSVMLLILIRLQARGELDIYDENLGRWTFCNGRYSLHFGFILRRYAIQLERDYQRRLQQRYGNQHGDEQSPQEQGPIRIMTREERRKAVEQLLDIQPTKIEPICACASASFHQFDREEETSKGAIGPASPTQSVGSSQEGPVCSICLDGYAATDAVFKSSSCAHMFHKNCLMEWLERRNNTECPCCRDPLVSDEEVWETVKRLRRERRRQLCKENGYTHRIVRWLLARRRGQSVAVENRNSTTSTGSTSSEEEDTESPREVRIETEQGFGVSSASLSEASPADNEAPASTQEVTVAEKSHSISSV